MGMTIEEWAKDFRSYINELDMPRDDYKGIMEYIDDAVAMLNEQEAMEQISDAVHETAKQFRQPIVRCKDCRHFDYGRIYKCRIHGSLFQPKDEDWFCADGEVK